MVEGSSNPTFLVRRRSHDTERGQTSDSHNSSRSTISEDETGAAGKSAARAFKSLPPRELLHGDLHLNLNLGPGQVHRGSGSDPIIFHHFFFASNVFNDVIENHEK